MEVASTEDHQHHQLVSGEEKHHQWEDEHRTSLRFLWNILIAIDE
jgi:hypothetical protein|tara:strand:- start:629 stop:763 length:135 start_codon:yes stop_codon:yes gene_type:complete